MKKYVVDVKANTFWVVQADVPIRLELSNLTDCNFVLSVDSGVPGAIRIVLNREGTSPEHAG